MRIIAGDARGRILVAPKGLDTRPTTDRVRESLMSSITSLRGGFEGAVVLDAFAGSGAFGLECVSRGAAAAVLCDQSSAAISAIERNVATCQMKERADVRRCDVLKGAPACRKGAFDIAFLDPPYAMSATEALSVITQAASRGLLSDDALIIYEFKAVNSAQVDKAAEVAHLALLRRKKYGETMLDTYERVL